MLFRSTVLFLALLMLAPSALADECTSRVYDTTGKVTDIAGIESTLKSIVGDGADPTLVRVITTAQMNEVGNLDKYAGAMLKHCPSWQSAGGNLKSNIFLMVVEPSGTIAILFNKNGPFQAVLGGKTQPIRNEMGGLLAKGDITGSIKSGLILTHSLLAAPRSAPVGASGPVTIVNHNEKPTDLSGLWTFMKWLLGLGVITGIIILVLRIKAGKNAALSAQQVAQNQKGACDSLILGFLSKVIRLKALLTNIKSSTNELDFEKLQRSFEALEADIDTAKGQFASAQGSANDPESSDLSKEQYDAMGDIFSRRLSSLEEIDQRANDLERSIRKITQLRESAQPAIDELGKKIEAAINVINGETTLKTDGPRSTLKLAIDAVELAEEKLKEKNYQEVLDTCKNGVNLATKAVLELKTLISRKKNIENAIAQIEVTDISGSLARVDTVIANTRQTYGEDSIRSAPGYRTTVSQKLNERRIAIAAAKSSATAQNWDNAEYQISVAQKATSSITDAVNRIEDIGPSILRQRQAQEAEEHRRLEIARQTASRSQSSGHSHSHHTTNITNYGGRLYDDDGPGFGTGLATGVLGTLAVESILDNERREERSNYGSRSNDDDGGGSIFGGDSGRSDSNSSSDSSWGGDSGSSDSSSSDSGGWFNSSDD
jgi:hypothetical protein